MSMKSEKMHDRKKNERRGQRMRGRRLRGRRMREQGGIGVPRKGKGVDRVEEGALKEIEMDEGRERVRQKEAG